MYGRVMLTYIGRFLMIRNRLSRIKTEGLRLEEHYSLTND